MAESEEIVNLVKKCNLDSFPKLTHMIATRLCNNKPLSYEQYSKTWSLEEWWSVTSYIEDHITKSVRNKLNKDQIADLLSPLPTEYRQCIVDVITVRKDEIHQYLLSRTSHISNNLLTDFDWQMKLVMSSDKYSAINEPLLNLDLQTTDVNKHRQVTSLELNKNDLKKLISSLEGASKAVQQLTT